MDTDSNIYVQLQQDCKNTVHIVVREEEYRMFRFVIREFIDRDATPPAHRKEFFVITRALLNCKL